MSTLEERIYDKIHVMFRKTITSSKRYPERHEIDYKKRYEEADKQITQLKRIIKKDIVDTNDVKDIIMGCQTIEIKNIKEDIIKYKKEFVQMVQRDTRRHDLAELDKKRFEMLNMVGGIRHDVVEWHDIKAYMEKKIKE